MIDIDRAEGHTTAAQRGKIRTMLSLLDELTAKYGKDVPVEEILSVARERGVSDAEEILNKMLREGALYSPKNGFVSKIL
jgi:DNA replicative helicase MCM subunit Mcm2 (Cdc46/Mcm family)